MDPFASPRRLRLDTSYADRTPVGSTPVWGSRKEPPPLPALDLPTMDTYLDRDHALLLLIRLFKHKFVSPGLGI